MTTRFGIFVPQGWRMDLVGIDDPADQFEAMVGVARQADAQAAADGTWDSIWLYDHFHTVPEPTQNSVFEVWTSTAALARETAHVKVGQMVGCNGYRQPSLYAKIASTVDAASRGRLYAGFGAGWYEHEWRAYGYEWTDIPTRMGRYREAVQIVHAMWTEDRPTFDGKHYSIDGPINEPKSGVPGRKIPLWIGGGGERVTLRLVAQYADACNVGGGDPEVIAAKLAVLREHCDTVGRDERDIVKSTSLFAVPVDGDLAGAKAMRGLEEHLDRIRADYAVGEPAIRAKIEAAIAAGTDYFCCYVPGLAYDEELLPRMAAIVSDYRGAST
jgi:F420-dependent oxidoreductase-like protein